MHIHIINDISEDSLFGSEEPPAEYNPDTLNVKIRLSVQRHYPDAEVTIEPSIYQTTVSVDDGDGNDWHIEDVIMTIIHNRWEEWLEELDNER